MHSPEGLAEQNSLFPFTDKIIRLERARGIPKIMQQG